MVITSHSGSSQADQFFLSGMKDSQVVVGALNLTVPFPTEKTLSFFELLLLILL